MWVKFNGEMHNTDKVRSFIHIGNDIHILFSGSDQISKIRFNNKEDAIEAYEQLESVIR